MEKLLQNVWLQLKVYKSLSAKDFLHQVSINMHGYSDFKRKLNGSLP